MSTNVSRQSKVEASQTNFQSKVASEQWLNIGGRDYRLVGKSIRIGRALDNDIVLDDKSVSRYHALLTLLPEGLILEDLKSRNGIKVNGERVRRSELKSNDQIKVGEMAGLYFQRVKKVSPKGHSAREGSPFARLDPELMISKIVPKVKDLQEKISPMLAGMEVASEGNPKRKKIIFASLLVIGFLALKMMSGGNPSQVQMIEASVSAPSFGEVVEKTVDKRAFQNCLEMEDLGNFRQAMSCFKSLPLNADVNSALSRIQRRQMELAEKRYKEGLEAFDNYYYDIAILKWQEVLLIADDASEFRAEAFKGISKAEQQRRIR